MTQPPKTTGRGAGRVAFLARFNDIQKFVREGHSLRAIHDANKDELAVSYGQFVRYVARYIRQTGTPPEPSDATGGYSQSPPASTPSGGGPAVPRKPRPAFVFDPEGGNKRKDLI